MIDFPIDITGFLPHRAPFLMVDVITGMDAAQVQTQFELLADNIFIDANGHFSESGLVENAAQTCSAIVGKKYVEDGVSESGVIGFISAIKSLKVHGLPKVGQTISTHSSVVSKFVTDEYALCTMGCSTFCEGVLLLEGEINLFIQQNATTQP